MAFPDDWPEDAKTGPKFLQELVKRFPGKVVVDDGKDLAKSFERFFAEDEKPKPE